MSKLLNNECNILVASAEAVVQKTLPPEVLREKSIKLSLSLNIDLKELTQKLISSGYTRSTQVEGQSQFSIRGSIVDIFPVQSALPVRIEFWGDEIDSISLFEIESQRRTKQLDEINIAPAIVITSYSIHYTKLYDVHCR